MSTSFFAGQNAHCVGMLVSIDGRASTGHDDDGLTDPMRLALQNGDEVRDSLVTRNLELEVQLHDPRVTWLTIRGPYRVQELAPRTLRVTVGDLYGSAPRHLGILFHVRNGAAPGRTHLGLVQVSADVVGAGPIKRRIASLPVIADLDGEDHLDPKVEIGLLHL